MNNTLTPEQKEGIRYSFTQGNFSVEAEIAKLTEYGYDEVTAKQLIAAEFREYKQALFQKAVDRNKGEERKKLVLIGVLLISAIGPLFSIESMLWYIIAAAGAGAMGYWGFKEKPFAGLFGSIVAPMVFPFAYNSYFANRTSYIKIELLIPMLIAAVPAIVVYYIVAKAVYSGKEEF